MSDDQVDDLLDDIDFSDSEDEELLEKPSAKASLQVNTFCEAIAAGQVYYGVWKKAGSSKAKCKEGAGGSPGEVMVRNICHIEPI
ncbi:hypothetical protein, partial [Okeania sp. SIO2B9]|uniref:hypothetical protein n=1 Tax=Okeania sp. SIO2B9 TaxID=2607782 RepID=UPI00142968A0